MTSRLALQLMTVFRPRRAETEALRDSDGVVAELARARDQADGAHHAVQPVDGPDDLERELRHAIAELGKRQALEHHIGEAAIGRRVGGALPWRRSADRRSAIH